MSKKTDWVSIAKETAELRGSKKTNCGEAGINKCKLAHMLDLVPLDILPEYYGGRRKAAELEVPGLPGVNNVRGGGWKHVKKDG